jgi:RpiR family transcriptional regulator, carbohydrate utilization regulator
MSLLAQLRDTSAKRSKSANKLTAYILEDPQAVLSMPIATLAAAVGVSEPTVNRYCTGLGLKGFPDFKLTLAAELGRVRAHITRNVEPGDSTGEVCSKIFEATQAAIASIAEQLDIPAVDEVTSRLADARSIVLCGLGASASVALDAQHKLLRFDIPVAAHTDIINQRVVASTLSANDCMLCISYSGRTIAMIELAELARSSGASVIGLTAAHSPLADACDLVLTVNSHENTDIYTPMTSRIGQLVLIDVIATQLALRRGPDFNKQLGKVKNNLAATRV